MKNSLQVPLKTSSAASYRSVAGLALALAAGCALNACKTEDMRQSNRPVEVRPLTASEARIASNSNEFAFRIFSRMSEDDPNKNLFFSPLSISTALTMAYNGANTTTKEAFRNTLGFQGLSDEDINQSYQSLSRLLVGIDPQVQFKSANSLWSNQGFPLQKPFVETSQTYFDANAKSLDFGDSRAKSTINGWVNEKTNGKIKTIVEQVTPDHLLFLINATYFKGTWTYPFDKKKTVDGSFHLEGGGNVNAQFMAIDQVKYGYYQDSTKQVMELPYGNGQFSMVFLLPSEQQTVQQLIGQLSSSALTSWLEQAHSSTLELVIPKFTFSYEKELSDILAKMGLEEAFGSQADFSRMIEGLQKGGVAISEVKHKAFVEVNEEGTEATAVTSVGVVLTSLPPSIRLDRPFVFLIREKATHTIVFAGKLMNP